MAHDYSMNLDTDKYTIRVSPTTNYGYFEHNKLGDECGGGLWFEPVLMTMELIDFDGVACLPQDVVKALRAAGFILDSTFD